MGLEHRDRTAEFWGTFDQSGMPGSAPVHPTDCGPDHSSTAVICVSNRRPDEAAAPIKIPISIKVAADCLAQFGAPSGCDGNPPDCPVTELDERLNIANSSPERDGRFILERARFAIRSQFEQELLASECN